jgi:hypothetical protein
MKIDTFLLIYYQLAITIHINCNGLFEKPDIDKIFEIKLAN